MKNVLILLCLFFSFNLYAEEDKEKGECKECLLRKEELCREECALVDENHKEECLEHCKKEYCRHKCSK